MVASFSAVEKKSGRGPKLREACFEDYYQISLLESCYGLAAVTYDEWKHLWAGNPLYRELRKNWPIGWVLEDQDRQIVGSMGNIPLPCEFEGRRILAASGRCWVAEPAYRSASLLLLDRLINQPGIDLYINSSVTLESAPSLPAFDCLRVPRGAWDASAFWITGHRGFAKGLLRSTKYNLPTLLTVPVAAGAYLKGKFSGKRLRARDVEVQSCEFFDRRFDDFWEKYRARNPHVLLAIRSRDILDWHFRRALGRKQLWIATVGDGRNLAAYAVFDRHDNRKLGLTRVRLVDYVSLDGGTSLLEPMLAWAIQKCRREGIYMLENVGCWLQKGEFMDVFAPYRRKLSAWTYFYRANHPALAQKLSEPEAWAPSLFDGNASL